MLWQYKLYKNCPKLTFEENRYLLSSMIAEDMLQNVDYFQSMEFSIED